MCKFNDNKRFSSKLLITIILIDYGPFEHERILSRHMNSVRIGSIDNFWSIF